MESVFLQALRGLHLILFGPMRKFIMMYGGALSKLAYDLWVPSMLV